LDKPNVVLLTQFASTTLILSIIVFFASFEQTISGFGFALIVMPLATLLLGLRIATPLIALAGLTLYTINLIRYHQSINAKEAIRLGIAAAVGVPMGVWGLVNLDESLVKFVLGFILVAYAALSFFRFSTVSLLSPRWVYLAGFVGGCLGGAYNIPGPPVIVYGSLRQWPRDEFRAVLQSLFFLTGLLAVLSHLIALHITWNIITLYIYAAPALLLGIVIGSLTDRRINKDAFRTIVLAMIFILGLSMILGVS
jgi:uncharacterized membrane protein YfcA